MADLLDKNQSPELNQVQQLAQLPQGLAIMKMENDSIMALAASHPRDIKQIKAELAECLEEFPAQANDMIYSKPVGWEMDECRDCGKKIKRQNKRIAPTKCWSCKSTNIKLGEERFARGLSVRAAELLSEAYGHNKVSSRVDPVDNDTVRISATFTDFQKGRIWVQESLLSKLYRSWEGVIVRHEEGKFLSLVCAAQASKCVREVINRSVNSTLKAWLYDECEKLIETNLTDDKIEEIVAAFAKHDVTKEMLENLIGKTASMGWSVEDRKTLMGVWNGIKSGEMSIAELFPKEDQQADETKKPETPPSPIADALKNPKGATEANRQTEEKTPEVKTTEPEKKPAAVSAFLSLSEKIDAAKGDGEIDDLGERIAAAEGTGDINDKQAAELNRLLNLKAKQINEG